jgi:phenylacetate-CoA ligase
LVDSRKGSAPADLEQERALRRLLKAVLETNPFYRQKLGSGLAAGRFFSPDGLAALPFTTKDELVADQEARPPFGTNLTYPLERYVRCHQTSGTRGRHPLRWLDTAESWNAFLDSWSAVLAQLRVDASDRVFVAFSFGPFIGFWGAFEAASRLGALALTGGALSTEQRLHQMLELEATILVSTPTYALHLAETAERLGLDLAASKITRTLHAGEPGAGLPAVRERLERAFGARCFDHAGATELGAWGIPHPEGLVIDAPRFIAELAEPNDDRTLAPTKEGVRGELVLTSLGRIGSPLIRYRTGDLVEMALDAQGHQLLRGGVLGRVDDMIVVRGVNLYPSAIENLVRDLCGLAEFRVTVDRRGPLSELELELEGADIGAPDPGVAERLARALHERLSLRIPISLVPAGSLPRWELKAKRFRYLERET